MKSIALTNKGKRKVNQDVILIRNIGSDIDLFIVADGMGGYDNGEVAAQMACESISTFLSNIDVINQETIQKAVNKANLAIRQFHEQNNSKMGTTLGAVILSKGKAKCFWVGDIKIFHYSSNKLLFESQSHNLLNELSQKDLSNDAFESSKYSHIVTRSIQGDVRKSIISYQELTINEKDKLIICSDGLHNIIDGQTMLYLMNYNKEDISFVDEINNRLEKEAVDNASMIHVFS